MVEFGSVADVLSTLSSINDRLQTPHRLKGRTRYFLNRQASLAQLYHSHPASTQSPLLLSNPTLNRSSFLNYIHLVLRSQKYSNIVADCEQLQADQLQNALLTGQVAIHEELRNLSLMAYIAPCRNVSTAEQLRKCPNVHLDALDDSFSTDYLSLLHVTDSFTHLPIHRWTTPAEVAPCLFANVAQVQKFAVLMGVASALASAHALKWYHRRLATDNIYIAWELTKIDNVGDVLKATNLVRITSFLCPTTGCFDGCSQCLARSKKAIMDAGDYFNAVTVNTDATVFSVPLANDGATDGRKMVADGKMMDTIAFARLVLWIYARGMGDITFQDPKNVPPEVMDRVPWPLRWIIRDCTDSLSMSMVVVYLKALGDKTIQPHVMVRNLMSVPAEVPRSRKERTDAILYQICWRSAAMGAEMEEPEALFHLGKLWEDLARVDIRRRADSKKVQNEFRYALECYRHAGNFGETWGFMRMARLQLRGLRGDEYIRDMDFSHGNVLRMLLQAAMLGNGFSVKALNAVAEHGLLADKVWSAMGCEESGSDQGGDCFMEKDLLDAVVAVGRCLRRGTRNLPVDLAEALAWLTLTRKRGHPWGALELGLLKVQMKESPAQMREGVNDVLAATNAMPNEAAMVAHWWLGSWYDSGLVLRKSNEEEWIVKRNAAYATAHLKIGAMAGHGDCMALYSRLLRVGSSAIKQNIEEAKEWNFKARQKKSAIAYYGHALAKLQEAEVAFQGLGGMAVAANDEISFTSAEVSEMSSTAGLNERPHSLGVENKSGSEHSRPQRNSAPASTMPVTKGRSHQEGYYDANGRVTRSGVAKLYSLALESLTEPAKRMSASHPEESENPAPLFLAASLILKNVDKWAACAYNGEQERELFVYQKRAQAMSMLKRVAGMSNRRRWKCLRVDFAGKDLEVVMDAKRLLLQLEGGLISRVCSGGQ